MEKGRGKRKRLRKETGERGGREQKREVDKTRFRARGRIGGRE